MSDISREIVFFFSIQIESFSDILASVVDISLFASLDRGSLLPSFF